jgi:hypothetical protein
MGVEEIREEESMIISREQLLAKIDYQKRHYQSVTFLLDEADFIAAVLRAPGISIVAAEIAHDANTRPMTQEQFEDNLKRST